MLFLVICSMEDSPYNSRRCVYGKHSTRVCVERWGKAECCISLMTPHSAVFFTYYSGCFRDIPYITVLHYCTEFARLSTLLYCMTHTVQ